MIAPAHCNMAKNPNLLELNKVDKMAVPRLLLSGNNCLIVIKQYKKNPCPDIQLYEQINYVKRTS